MAILNPDHLFEQAERLIASPAAGPPRQVDIRRAISSAYYGIFHAILTQAADAFVGAVHRTAQNYTLVYRSINHRTLRELCQDVKRPVLSVRYRPYVQQAGFGQDIQILAAGLVELQEKRLLADYDPSVRLRTSDAVLAIDMARSALIRLKKADAAERKIFLTLLLFPPR